VTVASGTTLTLDNVTVTGTTITDTDATSLIQIDGGTTLTLSSATIIGGTLSIGSGGTLDIEYGTSGPGATLDGVSVRNSGTVQVDVQATSSTLTLDNGTAITGGKLSIGSGSTLDVEAGTKDPGATLEGVDVLTKDVPARLRWEPPVLPR
jgi:hypothetical protein